MAEKQLVLYHGEAEFVTRFAAYLEKKSALPVRCRCFTDETALRSWLREKGADLMLVPEDFDRNTPEAAGIPCLLFTERREEGENCLPVYRSMNSQIRRLSRALDWEESREMRQNERAELIGFYSPVRGAGQSVSAILMGMQLAEEAPTLLINLERFSGLASLLPFHGGSLSDLLYFARVQGNPTAQLGAVTETYGPLSWIPPVRDPEDLRENGAEDWRFLLGQLQTAGLYRTIILDIGDGLQQEKTLLSLCDCIYCILREDELAQAKWREWQTLLQDQGESELLSRLRPFYLPPAGIQGWTEYRELRHLAWGRAIRALTETVL